MHTVYFDGASRSNPGQASFGASLLDPDGNEIDTSRGAIGLATNNYAEYIACREALKLAIHHNIRSLRVFGDSLLIINQINGTWRVKHSGLKIVHEEILKLIPHFDSVQFFHVKRNLNKRADELANIALDEGDT